MNNFEKLLDEAADSKVTVIEDYHIESPRIKGLCVYDYIALSDQLSSDKQRACILAEELGHYYTSSGFLLEQHDIGSAKQEKRARLWAYDKLIGLSGIRDALEHGHSELPDIAEYLGVTEAFLQDAIIAYEDKYGKVR